MSPRLRTLRDESGIAMIAAMAVLLLLLILTTGVVAVAVTASRNSSRDTRSKRALEAAEAGLQVARYRINEVDWKSQQATYCPPGSNPPATYPGDCSVVSVSLGNGPTATNPVTAQYYVSQAYTYPSAPHPACGGPAITVNTDWARCITSTGTVNGVTRRLQARVEASVTVGNSLINGSNAFIGVSSVTLDGSNTVTGAPIESDGTITLKGKNDSIPDGCSTYPGNAVNAGSNTCTYVPATSSFASQLQSVSTLNSTGIPTNWPGDTCKWSWDSTLYPITSQPCGNSNATGISGTYTYTASTRTLSMTSGTTATLCTTGQICAYNFCSISMQSNAMLNIAAGSRVLIFLDSAPGGSTGTQRTYPVGTTPCSTSGAGSILQQQGSQVNNLSSAGCPTMGVVCALNLQLYAWGDPGSPPTSCGSTYCINLNAAGTTNALVYAPNSYFGGPSATGTLNGSLVAYQIGGANVGFKFNFDSSVDQVVTGQSQTGAFAVSPDTWHECTAAPTGSSPESGC